MLQGRLTLAATALLLLGACASADGTERGALRENVIEPGITAITKDAPAANCGVNASTLQNAIDSFTLLEGDPPPDEQSLVDAGYLRETTTDWDVVDGVLEAENPACGPVPSDATIATLDIVTESEPLDADEVYATFDRDQIESVGGEACARELATIGAAGEAYVAEQGADPADIDELVATGYLADAPRLWVLTDGELVPADGSGCTAVG